MSEIITTLTILFGITSLGLALAKKFNQPVIPTYIISGIIAGLFIQQDQILNLAQIGIAFLVFVFGLKFDPERLKSVAKESQVATTLQIALIGSASYITALSLGFGSMNAVYFSLTASLSSTLVGLNLIEEDVQLDLIHGRLAESIHLLQDLIAIIAAAILINTQITSTSILTSLGYTFLIIGSALIAREYIYPWLIKQAEGTRELVLLAGLTLLIGYSLLAQYFGVSIIIGSFAAGITSARFPYKAEMIDIVDPIKDFFAIIFFASLGALLNFPSLKIALTGLVLILFTNLIKPGVTILPLLQQGYDARTSYLTGFSIDQISEFALIIAIQGYTLGHLDPAMFEAIILATTGSMIISSYTSRNENRLYEKLSSFRIFEASDRKVEKKLNLDEDLQDHVIVVGYDIQGKKLVDHMKEIDQQFVVIENNPEKVLDLQKRGENYIYGDVMHDQTWRDAKADDAQLIISTVPLKNVSEKILDLDIDSEKILRADEVDNAAEYLKEGAYYVSVDDNLTSEAIREHVIGIIGDKDYREELRRRNLLEVRRYLKENEG
jgi:CPA2 family monovalent cation:H+ antiporter-2